MAPSLLFDLSDIDLNGEIRDAAAIEAVNPHRGVMRLLDGIVHESECGKHYIGYRQIGHKEFWVEGHIPGRPIYPGVLMLESAAQLASYGTLSKLSRDSFMGFAGLDDVRFRGQVKPGDRLLILGKEVDNRPRRSIYHTQGLVEGTLVFEATVRGMPM